MRALKTGLISRVTIHAIDTRGNHKVVAVNGTGANFYWLWEGSGEPRQCPAEAIPFKSYFNYVAELAGSSPTAIRWTKHSLNGWLRMATPMFDHSLALEYVTLLGPDIKSLVKPKRAAS